MNTAEYYAAVKRNKAPTRAAMCTVPQTRRSVTYARHRRPRTLRFFLQEIFRYDQCRGTESDSWVPEAHGAARGTATPEDRVSFWGDENAPETDRIAGRTVA